jgi:hypothetical protein
MEAHPFDIDAFLAQPLVARVATNGPTVRPVWFLWEEGAFRILTGPWTKLHERVQRSNRTGTRGSADPFTATRARSERSGSISFHGHCGLSISAIAPQRRS